MYLCVSLLPERAQEGPFTMVIQERSQHDTYILEGSGRMDFKARHVFQAAMKAAQASEASHIVFDLSGITFIDSAGLALIILANRECVERNVTYSLCQPQGSVKDVFELTNMIKHMTVFDTLKCALSHQPRTVLL